MQESEWHQSHFQSHFLSEMRQEMRQEPSSLTYETTHDPPLVGPSWASLPTSLSSDMSLLTVDLATPRAADASAVVDVGCSEKKASSRSLLSVVLLTRSLATGMPP